MPHFDRPLTILDGAFGTQLTNAGMPAGVCPEKWAIEHSDITAAIVRSYCEAGSSIVLTPTLGGNPLKLRHFSLESECVEINRKLARVTCAAAGGCAVFGSVSSSGEFVEPFGEIAFEEAVNNYKKQVQGLVEGGVNGFFIETMIDLQETRAAVIAARESGLPLIASMSFDENGYTLTGTDIVSALCALQGLGITAFGCNCSVGPDKIVPLIAKAAPYARVPLCAKPNAGTPRLIDGITRFDLAPDAFAQSMQAVINAGASIIGGCCGTTPDHIRALCKLSPGGKALNRSRSLLVSSCRGHCATGIGEPFRIIGERINPTGKKALQAELKEGSFSTVRRFAFEQSSAGAAILDVNMGMPGIDEAQMMQKSVSLLSKISDLPLAIDTTSPAVAAHALRLYPGRALFNSISAENERLERVLPLVAEYGAAFIALPLDDEGIPQTASERMKRLERILKEAERYNLGREDIIVDALVMTIGSDRSAALVTLELIEMCAREGLPTICGLSNVSFGLPGREYVNAAFLAAGAGRGLTSAIANPSSETIMSAVRALTTHKGSVGAK